MAANLKPTNDSLRSAEIRINAALSLTRADVRAEAAALANKEG